MIKLLEKSVSTLAVTVLIGGISLAHPAFAVDDNQGVDENQSSDAGMMHKGGMHRVDERIKELHEKLGVTSTQETKWKAVANVMRQNEHTIHKLVEARNEMENTNAVQDLKSYEKIAVAHEQGLKRLIPAFERFYNSLTPDQKSNADDMFGNYEGRKEEGSAGRYNNIQPSSGGNNDVNDNSDANDNRMDNDNDTGIMANPVDRPPNQNEAR